MSSGWKSRFHRPALEREHAARPPLDEQDQKDQHDDLAKHSASERLNELVHHAQCQRTDQRAPQIADTAEHDDHEAVDDVALTKIGRDVVDQTEHYASNAGHA